MKPLYAKIISDINVSTYSTKEISRPFFSTDFHFHSECQITYVVHSKGKRIIGDSINSFESDELTLLGPDLPHVWHNSKKKEDDSVDAQSLALYFNASQLAPILSNFFDVTAFEKFISLSRRGLLFEGRTKARLKEKLFEIVKLPYNIKKLIVLIEIIEILLDNPEYSFLSTEGYTHNYSLEDNNRIDRVFKYVFDNFNKEISLEHAADMTNMTKQAFCRYFKSRTQKTFIQFVNEVRISESCKLITENTLQINNIAYECGFNSISNFNKTFKSIKKITPSEYKDQLSIDTP